MVDTTLFAGIIISKKKKKGRMSKFEGEGKIISICDLLSFGSLG